MSTPCTICCKYEDNTYHMIYCHFDGYPDGVGETLLLHYQDIEKIKELISLGDLSALGNTTKHTPEHWNYSRTMTHQEVEEFCVTYRDRGEKDVDASVYGSYDTYLNEITQHCCGVGYHYIFQDGKWLVKLDGYSQFVELTENLIKDYSEGEL